jgi:hypothetical protein
MKNKNLLIGGAVVVGGLLFFYFRNKRNAENAETPLDAGTGSTEKGMATETTPSTTATPSATATPSSTPSAKPNIFDRIKERLQNQAPSTGGTSPSQLSSYEVNKRLIGRCGIQPPSFQKNQRNNWDACKDKFKDELRSQGLISFNGMVEDNRSRLDFDGNIVD